MRLLKTSTLELENFNGRPRKPYAILSHVWIESEEVRHEDWLSGQRRDGYGHLKIIKLCEIARQGRTGSFKPLEHVWIDTCCINTRETGEQSAAFYSMFTWYEDSEVCLVFLPDVKPVDNATDATGIRQRPGCAPFATKDFLASKWFTRGWTLQELLAPRKVLFYNSEFEYIGSKSQHADGLIDLIVQATGIPESVLSLGLKGTRTCVAQRMSWASHRQTTIPEDVAYCLLGIFDVRMPLFYGEGPVRAFRRLQLEIIEEHADESIFTWMTETTPDTLAENGASLLATSPKSFARCQNVSTDTARRGRPSALVKRPGGLELEICLPRSFRPRRRAEWFMIYPLACTLADGQEEQRSCCLRILVQDSDHSSRELVSSQPKRAYRTGIVHLFPNQERRALWQALGWEPPQLLDFFRFEKRIYDFTAEMDQQSSSRQSKCIQQFAVQLHGLLHKPKRAKAFRLYFQYEPSGSGIAAAGG